MSNNYSIPKNLINERRETKITSFRLDNETIREIDNFSVENNISKTEVIRAALKALRKTSR